MLKWIANVSGRVLPAFMNRENGENSDCSNNLPSASSRTFTMNGTPRSHDRSDNNRKHNTSSLPGHKRSRPANHTDEIAAPTKKRRSRRISQSNEKTSSNYEVETTTDTPVNCASPSRQRLRRFASESAIATTSECCAVVGGSASLMEAPQLATAKRGSAWLPMSDPDLKSPLPVNFPDFNCDFKKPVVPSVKRESTGKKRQSLEIKLSYSGKGKRISRDLISPQQRTITSFFVKQEPIDPHSLSLTPLRCSPKKSKGTEEENDGAKSSDNDSFVEILKRCEKKVAATTRKVKHCDRSVPMPSSSRIIANKYHKMRTLKQEFISPIRKSPRLASSEKNTPIGILNHRQDDDPVERPAARKSLNFGPLTTPKKMSPMVPLDAELDPPSPELLFLPSMSPKMVTPTPSSPSLRALSDSPVSRKTPNQPKSPEQKVSPEKSPILTNSMIIRVKGQGGKVATYRMKPVRRSLLKKQISPHKWQLHEDLEQEINNQSRRLNFSRLNKGCNSPQHVIEDEGILKALKRQSPPTACMSPRATSLMTPRSRALYSLRKNPKTSLRIMDSPLPESTPKIRKRFNRETEDPTVAEFLYHLNEIRRIRVEQWVNGKEEREKVMIRINKMNLRGKQLVPHTSKWAAAWHQKKQMNFSLDENMKKLVQADVSNGLEPHPIPAWTYTASSNKPQFEYIKGNSMVAPLTTEHDPNWTICCSCEGECDSNCECVKASIAGGCFVADKFLVTSKYSDFYNTFLVACGPKCKCRANCTNSVDQILDATNRFELFSRDDKMGYGVRATAPLETNSILFEFQGEVINKKEHTQRIKKTNPLTASYSYLIYQKPGKDILEDYYLRILKSICQNIRTSNLPDALYIDPSRKGNLGRFFSHSEYPNAMCLRFIVNDARPEACRLLFYNTMPIRAGDEITFDYGQLFNMPNCLCGLLCCGHSGNHLLTQPKKRAYKMLNEVHSTLYNDIRKFAESELVRISHNREKFNIYYQKYAMLKARAKKPLIPKPKKSSKSFGWRNKRRRRNKKRDTVEEEPEQERERSPGTPSSTHSSGSDQSKENVKRVTPPARNYLPSPTKETLIALRPRS